MTDIRRKILWSVFAMSLVLLWDAWSRHTGQPSLFGPQPVAKAPAAAAANPAAVPGAVAASTSAGVPMPSAVAASAGVPTPTVPTGAVANVGAAPSTPAEAPGELVTVSTDVLRVQFDSRGAQMVKLELLKHADHNAQGNPVVLFDRSNDRVYLAQTGLVQNGLALPTHKTMMKALPAARDLAPGQDKVSISFEAEEAGGVKLTKTFSFDRDSYVVGVTHEVSNAGAAAIAPTLYLQLTRDGNAPKGESSMYFTFTGPAIYTDARKFAKIDFKDIEKGKADHDKQADNGWIAMVQHYFTAAWLLPAGQKREFRTDKVSTNLYSVAMLTPLGDVAAGGQAKHSTTLYVGPQEEKQLSALAPGLELVKDYGWFRVLASPLFWLLDKLHSVLGNWGWAIVALVVLLKAAFFSLNASAYRSMAKMKAVNPKVMEMRERLKDKPQQMQQEMMKIYREEKVNPLGGCLPIVVQMPFFIALYWVLLSSAEMRNAPWIGWIKDLSAPDTLFGVIPFLNMPIGPLPILMVASSMLQVALGAKPPDPVQARMMWMMPLAFGVMFFFFPAGLVLYWLTNNILSIAQQYTINKKLGVA